MEDRFPSIVDRKSKQEEIFHPCHYPSTFRERDALSRSEPAQFIKLDFLRARNATKRGLIASQRRLGASRFADRNHRCRTITDSRYHRAREKEDQGTRRKGGRRRGRSVAGVLIGESQDQQRYPGPWITAGQMLPTTSPPRKWPRAFLTPASSSCEKKRRIESARGSRGSPICASFVVVSIGRRLIIICATGRSIYFIYYSTNL